MRKSFAEAAASYLENGGSQKYLSKVVEHFGDRPLDEIFPYDIKKMAEALYPRHSGASRNRMAVTPSRAVIMHAYQRGWTNYMRVARFKEETPKRRAPASQLWLAAFLRQCDADGLPHIAALVLCMATTGARVSEAVALLWSDVDLDAKTLLLRKTKTERNSRRCLTDELARRLAALGGSREPEQRVFRLTSRFSVNERIRAVCDRADLPYKPSHTCGRHTFATSAIRMGVDIRSAMEAGGWKSSKVFLETYVHPRNAGRAVAERFNILAYENEL
jgi:integrase